MSVSVSGSKTVTNNVSPVNTASRLTTLMGTAVENLKVDDLKFLLDSAARVSGGEDAVTTKTLSQLFS